MRYCHEIIFTNRPSINEKKTCYLNGQNSVTYLCNDINIIYPLKYIRNTSFQNTFEERFHNITHEVLGWIGGLARHLTQSLSGYNIAII